ncbi:hypothetical protein ACH4SK_04180 [Streptomyces inhibens]|uniref:hypothetical protein n=1 Tax=Streptomyces inhibens TaxID=2293571 RepID=UPI0037A0875F
MNDSNTMAGRQKLAAPTTTSHIAAEPAATSSSNVTLAPRGNLRLITTNTYPRIAPGVTATTRPKTMKTSKAKITF